MRRSLHNLYGAIGDPRYVEFFDSLPGGDARWTTERIEAFLESIGRPQDAFHSFLVAGTNGKGSVASAIYGALRMRHRAGLFTSPHVVGFRERVRVDDCVPEGYIKSVIDRYSDLIERVGLTYFEFSTALAFLYFRDEGVSGAAVEVGLGGKRDATNVVEPLVSVITYVDYDHIKTLGPTLRHIAEHKAGIIKGAPVVTYEWKSDVLEVFGRRAREAGSEIYRVQDHIRLRICGMSVRGMDVHIESELTGNEYDVHHPVPGRGQALNVAATVLSLELAESKLPLSAEDVERGIPSFVLPGRFQMLQDNPPVVLDGAHNVSAIVHLVEVLKGMDFRPRTLVLSFMRDKKVEEMLSPLSEVSDRLIATEVPMPRCLPAEELARRALGVFGEVAVNPDPVKALREAASSGSVLITGSFYLAGEVLRGLRAPVCKGA